MRGISFKIRGDCYENILWTILAGIEIEKLCWHVSEDEVYNEMGKSIFDNSYIDGKTFLNTIREKSYYVIFANIKAYPPNSIPNDIEDYEEFIKSECELVLLCADVFYYAIYAKDNSTIKIIKNNAINNAIKNNIYDIQYITKENDGRTRFSVT